MQSLTNNNHLILLSALEDRVVSLQELIAVSGTKPSIETDELLEDLRQTEAIYDLLADAHTVTITSLTEALSTSGLASLAAVAGHDDTTASTSGRRS